MAAKADAAEATRKLLASLWEKNLPVLRERLDLLDSAARANEAGTITPEQRKEAGSTAHKLAGSLGMFGHPNGTARARSLEQAFDSPDPLNTGALLADIAALRRDLGW